MNISQELGKIIMSKQLCATFCNIKSDFYDQKIHKNTAYFVRFPNFPVVEWDFPTVLVLLLSPCQISCCDIKVFHAYTFGITNLSY